MSYRLQSKTVNYSDALSYVKSPIGLMKLATIVSQAIVCVSYPFFLDTRLWSSWRILPGVYFFYLSLSIIAMLGSILVFILTLLKLFKNSPLYWSYGMIATDILFCIFGLIDGIAYAVLANQRRTYFYFNPPAFIVCSLFSFISVVLFAIDLVLWSRNVVSLK